MTFDFSNFINNFPILAIMSLFLDITIFCCIN